MIRGENEGSCFLSNLPHSYLELRREPDNNFHMRFLVGILVGAALLFVVYRFYLQRMPTTDKGTAPTQAISLTGVRMDLLQIADAEHGYIATNGRCAPLDELVSSHSISRTGRDGYNYEISCSGNGFTATARHLPAPAGSPIRYPNFSVDDSLELHEVQ
jgi:hypothetical protein